MELLDVIRRSDVRITALAVIIGAQVSAMLSSVISVVTLTFQQYTYQPIPRSPVDVGRLITYSLIGGAYACVFNALVVAGTIWLLARILAGGDRQAA